MMQGQAGGGEVQVPSGRRIWLRSEAKLVRKPSPGTTLYILQQARDHEGQHGLQVIANTDYCMQSNARYM